VKKNDETGAWRSGFFLSLDAWADFNAAGSRRMSKAVLETALGISVLNEFELTPARQ